MVGKEHSIYAALITPMGDKGELDIHGLKTLLRNEIASGVQGFYCCGASGEGLLLSTDERKIIAQTVAEEAKGKVPFIVHTGSLGTREAIELSQHAQSVGAEAVSLIPPIYYHYSQAEVEGYYADVAKSVDLGVIVYNIPQFTGISFSKKCPLMQNEKIVGIKHTSMNLYDLERLSQAFPGKRLFNGFDEIWMYSQAAGASATIGTTVNVVPKIFIAIQDDFKMGRNAEAQAKQHLLNSFIEELVAVGIFPATKYCMTLLGSPSGTCRKPFAALDEQQKLRVAKALKTLTAYL